MKLVALNPLFCRSRISCRIKQNFDTFHMAINHAE